jgi:hypothetical protein
MEGDAHLSGPHTEQQPVQKDVKLIGTMVVDADGCSHLILHRAVAAAAIAAAALMG